jgi:ABC-2 type transport system ATP-binding protein
VSAVGTELEHLSRGRAVVTAVIEARALGKRYRRRWALSDCTLSVPEQKVVGLVGPNGAGKTTLLHLAVGLLAPTTGSVDVLSGDPGSGPAQLRRVGLVAQDTPTYASLSVGDHLRLGAWLNPGWDAVAAGRRIDQLGLDARQKAGSLSGGQRAQLALTLAIAKRPDLLILDEPVASLDPLARRDFLQVLTEVVAERGVSVVLSSHLVADLERVCDYLIVLVGSRVQITGEIEALLGSHRRIRRPRGEAPGFPAGHEVIDTSHAGAESTYVVRLDGPVRIDGPMRTDGPTVGVPTGEPGRARASGGAGEPVDLEELVLAYMSRAAHADGDRSPSPE